MKPQITEEMIEAFVQEKVRNTLMPWERGKPHNYDGNTFRAQETFLRAVIHLNRMGSIPAPGRMVQQLTKYATNTHWQIAIVLRRKGAIESIRMGTYSKPFRAYKATLFS